MATRPNNSRQSSTGEGSTQGPAVDRTGAPVVDPTKNVLDMVDSVIQRQDDLRSQESLHIRELLTLRGVYDDKIRDLESQLRNQEAARIDAIRAVDVAAVGRAAEVSATQASTLASQVATAAEAMRNQVAAAAAAAQQALTTALEPIQTAINDLRKAQYEQQGQKYAQSETRETSQTRQGAQSNTVAVVGLVVGSLIAAAGVVVALILKS